MFYSVTFFNGTTKKNTFSDWHLVPETRPDIAMPSQKTKYLEIPGADGIIDLSDSLTGGPLFNNREGSITFYILNGYDTFKNIKLAVASYLHGKRLKMVLEEEPGYYYEGRFSVSFEADTSTNHTKCIIDYNLNPYRRTCTISGATITDKGGKSL